METPTRTLPDTGPEEVISQLADLFRLMGDSSRLRIILTCLHNSISVSDIARQLELSQSLVSHHLRLLRAARVVRSERRGKQVFYIAADEHIQCVIEDMVAHVREPDQNEEEG
ncbi:MAG: winged helix-turn-helix transcriptional regulator [Gammaproteobacteria bacterium]|nr:winged helix-turn-helix transcriptional regulator [Gammaproteobacteria bacterium]